MGSILSLQNHDPLSGDKEGILLTVNMTGLKILMLFSKLFLLEAWGADSVGKVLAVQPQRAGSSPQDPYKELGIVVCALSLCWAGWRLGNPWSSLANQHSLIDKPWVPVRDPITSSKVYGS